MTAPDRANLRALCEAATMPPEPDHRGDCKCPECTAWVDRWAGAEDARSEIAAALPALLDALDAAEQRAKRLREALAFYAEPAKWNFQFTGPGEDTDTLHRDRGAKARAALEEDDRHG